MPQKVLSSTCTVKFATQIFHLSSLPRNCNQHSMASETTQHELFTTDADQAYFRLVARDSSVVAYSHLIQIL